MENLFAGMAGLPGAFAQGMNLRLYQQTRRDMLQQRREEADRAARMREQELAGRFGAYAVTGPDGGIDVQASARAMQAAQQAAAIGENEGMAGQSFADIPQELRGLPEYRQGFATGLAKRALAEEQFGRQQALLGERLRGAEDVARIRETSDAWRAMTEALSPSSRKPSPMETADITEDVEGLGRVSKKVPIAELPRLEAEAAVKREAKPLERANAELRRALSDVDAVEDNEVSLSFDATGLPKVTEDTMFSIGTSKASAKRQIQERIDRNQAEINRILGRIRGEGGGAAKAPAAPDAGVPKSGAPAARMTPTGPTYYFMDGKLYR